MERSAKQITEDALQLDADERAELLARLRDSLGASPGHEWDQAWEAESLRRLELVRSGAMKVVPADAAMAAARSRMRPCR
ncbi:MAG: addiction module protein [Myxococcales bacterium]|nr:addiction module protein [Myxococcales bacterium]